MREAFFAFSGVFGSFGRSSAFWRGFSCIWGPVIIMGDIYGSTFFFVHFENSNFGQCLMFNV